MSETRKIHVESIMPSIAYAEHRIKDYIFYIPKEIVLTPTKSIMIPHDDIAHFYSYYLPSFKEIREIVRKNVSEKLDSVLHEADYKARQEGALFMMEAIASRIYEMWSKKEGFVDTLIPIVLVYSPNVWRIRGKMASGVTLYERNIQRLPAWILNLFDLGGTGVEMDIVAGHGYFNRPTKYGAEWAELLFVILCNRIYPFEVSKDKEIILSDALMFDTVVHELIHVAISTFSIFDAINDLADDKGKEIFEEALVNSIAIPLARKLLEKVPALDYYVTIAERILSQLKKINDMRLSVRLMLR